jgi:hypothetical protein
MRVLLLLLGRIPNERHKTKRKRELLKVSRTEIKTEVTRKVVTEVVNTEVALDATNAGELIAELSALRDAIDANETKVEAIKAKLYELMDYQLVNKKWVGDTELGTIGGNVVLKIATINNTKFDKDALIADKPELDEVLKAYTKPAPYKALKIVK